MRQAVAPAGLEHCDEAITIGADAGDGIVDRRAHAGLRREVHHAVGRDLVEHARHRSEIGKIDLVECEGITLERLEASALERRIIVRGYCVDADNSFPARKQALTDMHADEAGSAGNHHGGQNKLRCSSSYTALPDRTDRGKGSALENGPLASASLMPGASDVSHPKLTRRGRPLPVDATSDARPQRLPPARQAF